MRPTSFPIHLLPVLAALMIPFVLARPADAAEDAVKDAVNEAGRIARRDSIIVVAPHDAPEAVKAAADLVADGRDDQQVLERSLMMAPKVTAAVDSSPVDQEMVTARGRHSVRWLPGVYNLDAPLTLPDAIDMVIEAEGATLNYRPADGDAVTITGMHRARYRFGTIVSGSAGAALRIAPTPAMPSLMSEVTFTGLVGVAGVGVGLDIDPSRQNVTTNKISGTDVGGFETCVRVSPPAAMTDDRPGFGKMDTNHFWLSYVRRCRTGILVAGAGGGVDSNFWDVNVDASLPGSTAIRTAAAYDRWRVIMGVWAKDGTAVILDPGAHHNVLDVTPPLGHFRFRDNSGNRTNALLGVDALVALPPPAAEPQPGPVRLLADGIGPENAYNLLSVGERLIALRRDLGAVDPNRDRLGGHDMPPLIYRAANAAAARARIVADGRDPGAYAVTPLGLDESAGVAAHVHDIDARAIGRERLGARSLAPWLIVGADRAEIEAALAAPPLVSRP